MELHEGFEFEDIYLHISYRLGIKKKTFALVEMLNYELENMVEQNGVTRISSLHERGSPRCVVSKRHGLEMTHYNTGMRNFLHLYACFPHAVTSSA